MISLASGKQGNDLQLISALARDSQDEMLTIFVLDVFSSEYGCTPSQ